MALSCISSEIKPDIGRIVIFHILLHSAPPLVGSPSEYCHPIWYEKTRMAGQLDGEKTLRICVIVYTQYWRVTDGQTDILPRHSPRYAYASRGKKRVPGLPVGENFMILCSLVLTHYQRVTNRQTDRHSACSQVAIYHS